MAPTLPELALLRRVGIVLNNDQIHALRCYAALVERWNPVAGLVSSTDLERFGHRHLLDSLALVSLIRNKSLRGATATGLPADSLDASVQSQPRNADLGSREAGATGAAVKRSPPMDAQPRGIADKPAAEALPIADFGSGAGLPGIPLAIAVPEVTFVLVDRGEKKARFLRRAIYELKLPNVRVRCEDVARLTPNGYAAVVARALMPLAKLWPFARSALAPGGYLLLLDKIVRSHAAPEEQVPSACGGGTVRRHWTHLPEFGTWHGVLEVAEVDG